MPKKSRDLEHRSIKEADTRVNISMTPRESMDLLQRLAGEDNFRAEFESNCRECLASYHINIPASAVPEKITLPAKEDIRDAITSFTVDNALPGGFAASPVFIVFIAFIAFTSK